MLETTLAISLSAVCLHASFMYHLRALFSEIASFALQSTFIVYLWPCLLVRAGHGIWRSQGERWNTSFTIFAIMVVFWFFLGFGDYQGLSLWNYSILAEKKKMDCADPVLFLGGRLQYYPGLTPLAKRQSQWPSLWQKHSICKERRKSHHNDVWLFCLTPAAGPWDPWTATQPPSQWLLYKRTNTTLQISSCNTQRQCTCHHTTTRNRTDVLEKFLWLLKAA